MKMDFKDNIYINKKERVGKIWEDYLEQME